MKIIYRPHPYRQDKDTIIRDRLENVKIDPRVFKAYKTGNKNFHHNLQYYPNLIKNAKFVIRGLKSMIIEALIFRKKYYKST